ncbi:MAG TPA: hypothetical protein VHI93_00335 [Candidatus Thermoplasmatota archaeon]|nr:hypothetical protein [Candidatus Thermoplasmatota archaeon]
MSAGSPAAGARVLLALASLLLLPGCLGYPPGSARPGDAVDLIYTATDATTGQVVVEQGQASVVAGQPSMLGPGVDRALVGRAANDTFVVESSLPDTYSGTQSVPAGLGRASMESRVARALFEASLGPPSIGQEFRASALYNATVVALEGANVTYRLAVTDGQEIPIPDLGLKLVHRIEGDDLVRSLAPLPGATFSIEPGPGGQTPLGLPPGSYRTRGLEGDSLVFDHSAVAPAFFGKAVRFGVTVVAVHPRGPPPAPTGEYGHRSSPQVLGDPAGALDGLAFHH